MTYSPLAGFTVADVIAVARHSAKLDLIHTSANSAAENSRLQRIRQSAEWVRSAMRQVEESAEPAAYYGINTGFGDNAGRATFKHVDEAEVLSRKLLLSHTVGVGDPLPEDVVRAALLIRVISLARGYSGVRIELINTLIEMLNRGVFPIVPSQGSLGASGDLAPLAHLVIPLRQPLPGENPSQPGITGHCYLDGKIVSGAEAMAAAGISQNRLACDERIAVH